MVPTSTRARPAGLPRRWLGVLPVVAAALLLVGLAAAVSPAVREQVGLSTTRRPASYVELYFPAPSSPDARAGCTRDGTTAQVRFVVRSHLQRAEGLDYRVRVDPAGGARVRAAAGTADTRPGAARTVTERVRVPAAAAYVVSVDLPALDQQLRARCPAAG